MRHDTRSPPRQTISQAPTLQYADMVRTRDAVVPDCFDSPEL